MSSLSTWDAVRIMHAAQHERRDIRQERFNDMAQVARVYKQMGEPVPSGLFSGVLERRARPRCTHTAENMMRMEGHCPACSPEQYAAQLASAPDVATEDA